MKTAYILSAFLLSFAICCRADTRPTTVFEQANLAYSRGDYQQAIDQYLKFVKKNGVSASLLYNLANSYASVGQTGKAVLNYERALRLSPGDTDIQANLEQIRKDAGLYSDHKPVYERLAELLQADQWLLISGFSFFLFALSTLGVPYIRHRFPTLTRLLLVSTLLLSFLTLPPALFRYGSWHDNVVIEDRTRLLLSPFPGAASTGTIKAGRLVRPQKTHGNYVRIEDKTGRNGWVKQSCLEPVAKLPSG